MMLGSIVRGPDLFSKPVAFNYGHTACAVLAEDVPKNFCKIEDKNPTAHASPKQSFLYNGAAAAVAAREPEEPSATT